jgi:hypothetical protein
MMHAAFFGLVVFESARHVWAPTDQIAKMLVRLATCFLKHVYPCNTSDRFKLAAMTLP